MKVFLAAINSKKYLYNELKKAPYILESFYYIKEWQYDLIYNCNQFLLDSGAFTYMNGSKKVDFDEYLNEYIKFINEHDIQYFFELDIDVVVGLDKVEEYRKRLELETGKKSIPVWHKDRGIEYFKRITREYDYVAIGGIVTKEIKKSEHDIFHYLIDIAHKNNCSVHGLGYTDIKGAWKYNFDTVDSTSWTSGSRFGTLYQYKMQTLKQIKQPEKTRVKDYKKLDEHNLKEWIKYVKLLDSHKNKRK